MHKKILVTGGSGFIGEYLVKHLLSKNYRVVIYDINNDLNKDLCVSKKISFYQGDIRDANSLEELFKKEGHFHTVFHLAAELPTTRKSDRDVWETNVLGTSLITSKAVKYNTKNLIFTSSNTVYGIPKMNPITEKTPVEPFEIYGKSKMAAEKELGKYKNDISIVIFRPGVVSGKGRLGLQAILYEFIYHNKNIYTIDNGLNKYQFIDVNDLCIALEKASLKKDFAIYNIGADEILPLKELYQNVIEYAGSKSRIVHLPTKATKIILSITNKLNISPIGPYHTIMLNESLFADTNKIKKSLKWQPTKTNLHMFIENYSWFIKNKKKLKYYSEAEQKSHNKTIPNLGILRLLKYIP